MLKTREEYLRDLRASEERMRAGIKKLHQEMYEKGIPFPKKDDRCKKPDQWIYMYPDGHEELVEINDNLVAVISEIYPA